MMTKVEKLAAALPQEVDGAIITSPHNRRYLTGFPSSAGLVLVTKQTAYFLTDFRYIEAAKRVVLDMECVEYKKRAETLRQLIKRHGLSSIAVEDEGLTRYDFSQLDSALETVQLRGGILDGILKQLRLVKTAEELEKICQAQALTDFGFNYILSHMKPGRTEREIALELEFALRRQGAEATAFDIIVVAGENSSLPHGVPSERALTKGDLVTMDFGAMVDGWCSDMTRTIAVGCCSEEQRHVYHTVLDAQEAALSVLRGGLSCVQGDAAARDIISAAGFGECFGHGTGHGVGVEIHEAPRLSPTAGDETLQVGSVVTVEPGIYLPGRFGVRIEDMVCITQNGCENLTASPKSLMVV
mgnify:FL=1